MQVSNQIVLDNPYRAMLEELPAAFEAVAPHKSTQVAVDIFASLASHAAEGVRVLTGANAASDILAGASALKQETAMAAEMMLGMKGAVGETFPAQMPAPSREKYDKTVAEITTYAAAVDALTSPVSPPARQTN